MKHDSTAVSDGMKAEYTAHLSHQEYEVLANKATDRAGEGGYTNFFDEGTYHCRACGAPLYKSDSKFHSGCGWPSFDTEIAGAVTRHTDKSYGMVRTEIVCSNCGGHLGHVFEGEGYTKTNTRHCVNTSSILFHPKNTQVAYIGMGPFHDAQAELQKLKGVLYTEVGYANVQEGTSTATLSYEHVESGATMAVEVVKVEFDPSVLSYDSLLHEVLLKHPAYTAGKTQHFPTILTTNPEQMQAATAAIAKSSQGTTTLAVTELSNYHKAESEHQNYVLRQQRQRH